MILKPSEKTPLTAIRLAEILYEAGLPGRMLSVLLGPTQEVAEPLVQDPRVDMVASLAVSPSARRIAKTAGYKRLVLELGGNDPLIVLDDARPQAGGAPGGRGFFPKFRATLHCR